MSETGVAARGRDLLLGVDIGGTKILAGLMSETGDVIERRQIWTRPDHILSDTLDACRDLIDRAARTGHQVTGIGVGAKGAVDRQRGVLLGSLALGQGEIAMRTHLEMAFGLPVWIENDVHAATLGEKAFGIGSHVDDFLFYNAGTGIMIGIVVGGRRYRGASNTAGENGHFVVDASARWPCTCGLSGCLETGIIAGRRGMLMPTLAGFAHSNDDTAYAYLASSLLDMIGLFDPAAIVLGGGMLKEQNRAMRWVAGVINDALQAPPLIVPASAGEDAGLVGAAALAASPQ